MEEMYRKKQIRFKDLSTGLKWAIVLAWIAGILDVLSFLYGFLVPY